MKSSFIDTNIFLRFLTADDKGKYAKCRQLFEKTVSGKELLVTSEMVIAEVVWTLLSFYKVPKQEVIEKVSIILNTPNLKVENQKILTDALAIYSIKNINFIDAYNSAYMRHKKLDKIYSYDTDFDKIELLKRAEP